MSLTGSVGYPQPVDAEVPVQPTNSASSAERRTCCPAHIHRKPPVLPIRPTPLSTGPLRPDLARQRLARQRLARWAKPPPEYCPARLHPPRPDPSQAAPKMITRVWLLFEHKPRDHEREGATGRRRLDRRAVRPGWQAAPMRPALKSGLLPVWRDRDTLQTGIDPRRAVALSGMGHAAFVVGLLDGSRDRDQVIAAAAGRGIPVQTTQRILTLLAAAGALDDFPASTLR